MGDVSQDIIDKAYDLFENGDSFKLYALIKPYLNSNNTDIDFIYASFSLPEFNETSEEFDVRHMAGLHKVAERNNLRAIKALANEYAIGDEVKKNEKKAAELFEKGANLEDVYCIMVHGLNLFYGLLKTKKDEEEGFRFIKKAYDIDPENSEYEYKKALEILKSKS